MKVQQSISIEHARAGMERTYIEYMNAVGGESSYLAFGHNEYARDEAGVRNMIVSLGCQKNGLFLVAHLDGEIIGALTLEGSQKPRLNHSVELGMTVKKSMWGQGVGSRLLAESIKYIKCSGIVTRAFLQVRVDNIPAIRLYHRFHFLVEGMAKEAISENGQKLDLLNMYRLF